MSKNDPAERTVRDIRRKTRKQYTAEEKIRIVVSGLRGIMGTCGRRTSTGWAMPSAPPEVERGKKALGVGEHAT